jgi:23S rRNA (adenine2503-C2)-methyltransferase
VLSVPLNGLTRADLSAALSGAGCSAHQAALAFKALHRLGIHEPARMPGITGRCRAFLETFPQPRTLALDSTHAASDGTTKLRLRTHDNLLIETVIIPAPRRTTLCVSSQVGCAAACAFCYTGTMGLTRNLEAWEITEQVRMARGHWTGTAPITNFVFMGMGEPLHNEANVLTACRILGDPQGLGVPRRHLVVSTAGVGARLRPFWEQHAAALAISLHATTDDVRNTIVPLNRQCNLAALRAILLGIPWAPRESVTIAYLLLDGVNDSADDARRLAAWVQGLPAKVNLLEFNAFPGSAFRRSPPKRLAQFRQWLRDAGIFNTLRHSRGEDAMAACGQLATASRRARRK